MLLNMFMVYKCLDYKYVYTLFLNYKVLAPPNLMCENISLARIRELCATPSWWEPPLKSRFYDIGMRYGSCVLHLRGGNHLQNPYPVILAFRGAS